VVFVTARPSVGLMLPTAANPDDQRLDPPRVLEAARSGERAGFDGAYVGDHVLHPRPLLESMVSLAAVAATTSRIVLGPCVLLLALRQPAVIASQLRTLAAYAPGRLRVGVGVGGEYPAEFEAVGVPLDERGSRLAAALCEVRGQLPDTPFLLAGWRPAALRRAAAHGDGWIGYLQTPQSFARRRAMLHSYLAEAGRADSAFTTGMLVHVHIGTEVARAREQAAAGWQQITASAVPVNKNLFVAGPAEAVVEQLHEFWQAGCTDFVLGPANQGHVYLEQVDLLASQVLPVVRSFR
jgi:alkanesulfonate monooxygenase SsuD/methylene tetrahydromethanopterin reductase-like flavin-dependent oxidoreductase (luciferase family)